MSQPATTVVAARIPATVATELRDYAGARDTTASKLIGRAVAQLLADDNTKNAD